MGERHHSTTRVAERLDVSPETIRLWVHRGYFPNAWRSPHGGPWRIPESDVRTLVEKMKGQIPPNEREAS